MHVQTPRPAVDSAGKALDVFPGQATRMTIATILKRMENLASILRPLVCLSLLTRWPIRSRLELPDRHRALLARQGDAIPVESREKHTDSLRSFLKQLDEVLVNCARLRVVSALRSESIALRRAHESTGRRWNSTGELCVLRQKKTGGWWPSRRSVG